MVMKTCKGSKISKKPPLYKNKTKSTNSSGELNLSTTGSEKKTKKMEVNRIQQIKERKKAVTQGMRQAMRSPPKGARQRDESAIDQQITEDIPSPVSKKSKKCTPQYEKTPGIPNINSAVQSLEQHSSGLTPTKLTPYRSIKVKTSKRRPNQTKTLYSKLNCKSTSKTKQ